MSLLAAVALGILIGLSLGALGGGGSILTVPALVYVVGESAHAATTESLVIVGITSLAAAVGHAKAGHVKWVAGMVFGSTGIAASYLGTAANRAVNPNVLLLSFAGLIVVAATAMLLRQRGSGRSAARMTPSALSSGDRAETDPHRAVLLTRPLTASPSLVRARLTPAVAAKMLTAGLAVGFLTGFFGVGGGFVIVPALVMALGYEMPIAVGTSLLVIAINSAAALLARSGHETFHWVVIAPFTLAAIAGSLAGKRVADRVEPATLMKAFVGLLFAVAMYVAIRSGVALSS